MYESQTTSDVSVKKPNGVAASLGASKTSFLRVQWLMILEIFTSSTYPLAEY